MKYFIKWTLRALFVLFLFTTVKAEPYNEFSVKPMLPAFQREEITGYFDLDLREKQVETIYIELHNEGDQDAEISIKLYSAATGVNAKADYQKDINSNVSSIKDIIFVEDKVLFKAKKRLEIPLDIRIPTDTEISLYMGSIELKADILKKDKEKSLNTEVKNRVMYLIPIKIRSFDAILSPNINYLETKFEEETLKSLLENDQSLHMGNVQIEGNVMDMASEDIVGSLKVNAGEILPNTNFEIHYDLKEDIKNNHPYQVSITVEGKEATWDFLESFQVEILNDIEEKPQRKKHPSVIFIPFVIIIIIFIFIKRKSRS